jgi:hypothetical protein
MTGLSPLPEAPFRRALPLPIGQRRVAVTVMAAIGSMRGLTVSFGVFELLFGVSSSSWVMNCRSAAVPRQMNPR